MSHTGGLLDMQTGERAFLSKNSASAPLRRPPPSLLSCRASIQKPCLLTPPARTRLFRLGLLSLGLWSGLPVHADRTKLTHGLRALKFAV